MQSLTSAKNPALFAYLDDVRRWRIDEQHVHEFVTPLQRRALIDVTFVGDLVAVDGRRLRHEDHAFDARGGTGTLRDCCAANLSRTNSRTFGCATIVPQDRKATDRPRSVLPPRYSATRAKRDIRFILSAHDAILNERRCGRHRVGAQRAPKPGTRIRFEILRTRPSKMSPFSGSFSSTWNFAASPRQ